MKELKKCLESIYSDSEIKILSDPLMAVKHGYNNHIDVIYTEIDMKGMNGFDMTRLITQKQRGKISVIFVTRSNDYRDDAMNWGADGYLLKPISRERLEKENLLNIERYGRK